MCIEIDNRFNHLLYVVMFPDLNLCLSLHILLLFNLLNLIESIRWIGKYVIVLFQNVPRFCLCKKANTHTHTKGLRSKQIQWTIDISIRTMFNYNRLRLDGSLDASFTHIDIDSCNHLHLVLTTLHTLHYFSYFILICMFFAICLICGYTTSNLWFDLGRILLIWQHLIALTTVVRHDWSSNICIRHRRRWLLCNVRLP